MDDINPEFSATDVVLVIGATTWSTRRRAAIRRADLRHADPRRDKAKNVVVLKRSMAPGSPASRTRGSTIADPDVLRRRQEVAGGAGQRTAALE